MRVQVVITLPEGSKKADWTLQDNGDLVWTGSLGRFRSIFQSESTPTEIRDGDADAEWTPEFDIQEVEQ